MKRIMVITGVLATFLISSLTVLGQSQSRSDVLNEIQAKRTELVTLEKSFLDPSEEDRVRYAAFLDQPGTGLIRLLPREKFDSEVYKNNKRTITMRGGGSYYSFLRNTQEYGYGSDISLDSGQLHTGFAGADYGMLTDLGDIPLESVGAETPAVTLFAAYQPPQQEQLARKEARRIAQGSELEGLPVKRSVPLKLNSTFLLRSINYSSSDVLVAFKVVRIDSDGSATILWKLLKKYGKPKFIRAETVDVG
ncbi:MAG TPA: hypothetical protein VM941_00345 [Pyrinomonadaceae bacterium]|jgi:hypothetical protein|nr:hypothetical protein [Pyrinomonadaceae bacterium]